MKKLFILAFLFFHAFAVENYLPDIIAFKSSLEFKNPKIAELIFDIAPGYDIYADKIQITTNSNSSSKIGNIVFPPPVSLSNETLGDYKVYQGIVYIPIPISSIGNGNLNIDLTFQGCKGLSYCYPGMKRTLASTLNKNSTSSPTIKTQNNINFMNNLFSNNVTDIGQNLIAYPILTVLGFFILGLLISGTPCVFPLFPILLSIIAGKKSQHAFRLALVYILGGSFIYSLAGILVSYIGIGLQSYFQNIWAALFMAILLIIFSISLFGVFDIKLPDRLSSKLNLNMNNNTSSYLQTFMIGAISTLILSPCVTAPLAGALIYISTSHNILLGGMALFTFGLGIGFPLLLIALLGNHFLPQSGAWMLKIKQFLAMIMLIMAIYTLHNFLSKTITYTILGFWFIGLSVLFYNSLQKKVLRLFFSFIILCIGIALIIYPRITQTTQTPKNNIFTTSVTNSKNLTTLLNIAKGEKKVVILDFSASWCMACREMELTTWINPELLNLMAKTTNIRVDVTKNDDNSKLLEKTYNVFAPPAVIVINGDGKIIKSFMGNTKASEIIPTLQLIKDE